MEKSTLNESLFLQKMFDAVGTGDFGSLDNLMDENKTELSQPEVNEALDLIPQDTPDEKEEKPVEDTTATEKPTDTKNENEDKWIESLPEEVRADVEARFNALAHQNARLDQYYKSNEGRVSALHKQINRLNAVIEDLKTPAAKPAPQETTKVDDADIEFLKENDPQLYGLVSKEREERRRLEERYNAIQSEFDKKLKSALDPIAEVEHTRYMEAEAQKILAQVPDAREIVSSPDWQRFKTVVAEHAPGVAAMAESNNSGDFVTAIWMYKQWKGEFEQPTQQVQQRKEEPTQGLAAQKVIEERERKLRGSGVTTRPATPQPLSHKDEASAIEEIYQALRAADGKGNK